MKKIIVPLVVAGLIVIGILGISIFTFTQSGLDITVKNQTDKEISGLHLTYHKITKDIEIPPVRPTEDFGENSMTVYYKDANGERHSEYVFGYFEKGYSGDAVITLKSIDKSGEIEMKVVNDLF